jgi:hypothetical protein
MAISGQQTINVGLPNNPTNSDSLYTAFTKIQNNFTNVFSNATSLSSLATGYGIDGSIAGNTITINNTGVTQLLAGTGISISSSNGNVSIAVSGSANGTLVAGVTSIGVSSSTLSVVGSPVVGAGTIIVDLPNQGVAGSYAYPSAVTVDNQGRVTAIAPGSAGTVSSVTITGGSGLTVTSFGAGVTGAVNYDLVNTGVTSLVAGNNMSLSSSTGAIILGTSANMAVTNLSAASNVSASNITVTGSTTIGTVMKLIPTSTEPTAPSQGMIYYDSAMVRLRVYNGTAWGNVTIV